MTKIAVSCRICGGSSIKHLFDDRLKHDNPQILHHCRCLDCGCVFVGNELSADDLSMAYSGSNWARYYADIESENVNKMRSAVADMDGLPRTSPIIDIGTGNGMYLRMLRDAGFSNLAGHEIVDTGQHIDGVTFYFDDDYHSIPSEAFECVTLLDVVEHVPDVSLLFAESYRIAKKGGQIYFHTPVVTPMDRLMHECLRIPGIRRIAFTWLRGRTSVYHLQNYTASALRTLLTASGFSDIKIDIRNELSWPVSMYVRTYLVQKYELPAFLVPLLTPIFYPFLASDYLNPNKAIVSARKV